MFEGWCSAGVSVRETGELERSEPPDDVLCETRRLFIWFGGGVPVSDCEAGRPLPSKSDYGFGRQRTVIGGYLVSLTFLFCP